MLWRFYVYLQAVWRGEVLFKLNGAKLSERGIEVVGWGWKSAAAVCKLLSRGDNLNAYFASYIILLLPAKLSRSMAVCPFTLEDVAPGRGGCREWGLRPY